MIDEPSERTFEILLVEDNPGDARLAMEALRECSIRNRLHRVENGVEAMTFLNREGEYKDMPTPDMILLDLNMPWKDGREVLREVKADADLKRIPIVVLTVSKAEEDILQSYDLHANCYLSKPIDLAEFELMMKAINDFWLNVVKLPRAR